MSDEDDTDNEQYTLRYYNGYLVQPRRSHPRMVDTDGKYNGPTTESIDRIKQPGSRADEYPATNRWHNSNVVEESVLGLEWLNGPTEDERQRENENTGAWMRDVKGNRLGTRAEMWAYEDSPSDEQMPDGLCEYEEVVTNMRWEGAFDEGTVELEERKEERGDGKDVEEYESKDDEDARISDVSSMEDEL